MERAGDVVNMVYILYFTKPIDLLEAFGDTPNGEPYIEFPSYYFYLYYDVCKDSFFIRKNGKDIQIDKDKYIGNQLDEIDEIL